MRRAVFLFCAVVFLGSSCLFGPSKFKGVMSYRHGRVFLQGGRFYLVGRLPDGWRRIHATSKAISFYNDNYKSSITTDAFCAGSFSDRPLDSLAGELSAALSERTTVSTANIVLDGRDALRLFVKGSLDGAKINMDIVVIKKDGCSFDFVAALPPDAAPDAENDFKTFFEGFHY